MWTTQYTIDIIFPMFGRREITIRLRRRCRYVLLGKPCLLNVRVTAATLVIIMTIWNHWQIWHFFITAVCNKESFAIHAHLIFLLSTLLDFWAYNFQSIAIFTCSPWVLNIHYVFETCWENVVWRVWNSSMKFLNCAPLKFVTFILDHPI